jgi:hypothetical protein
MARARDEAREQRIVMEAVLDAHDSNERAMGWHYYLDGKMNVPFKALALFQFSTGLFHELTCAP